MTIVFIVFGCPIEMVWKFLPILFRPGYSQKPQREIYATFSDTTPRSCRSIDSTIGSKFLLKGAIRLQN